MHVSGHCSPEWLCLVLAILTTVQAAIPVTCSPPLSFQLIYISITLFFMMAHMKDLHLNMLQKVFAYFHGTLMLYSQSLNEFKQLLHPASVCRVWRECIIPYVYYTAYLEYHIKETDGNDEVTQTEHEWRSNIDLIVSQRLSSAVKELKIQSFGCSHNFKDMIRALDTFGFSSNHWQTVNTLRIKRIYKHLAVDDDIPSSSDDEMLAAQLTEYFARRVPNTDSLWVHIKPSPNISTLLTNTLANLYILQLRSLYCYATPIDFNYHSFSSKLRNLQVGIASGVASHLPELLASPLEELQLSDIPLNFTWRSFIGITPDHIEFTNLHQLSLSFRQLSELANESNGPEKKVCMDTVSFDIGCRKLFFPKLRSLSISNSPYHDSALHSMFIHSPLEFVGILGSPKSVQHVDPRILLNARQVNLQVDSVISDNYYDFVQFFHKLLSLRCSVKASFLGVGKCSVSLPIPGTIEWVNLEHLRLDANTLLSSVIQVITQLPKLHTLAIENAVDMFDEAGANLQVILRAGSPQVPSITTSLKNLSIYCNDDLPLVFSLDLMCYLTILICSLDKVVVPDLYVFDIKGFAVRYGTAFPHLWNIKIVGRTNAIPF